MKPHWKPSFSWLCSGRGLANPAFIGCFKFQLRRNCRFLFSSQLTLFTKNSQPLDGQPVFIKLPQLCKRTASCSNYPCALEVKGWFSTEKSSSWRKKDTAAAATATTLSGAGEIMNWQSLPAATFLIWVICHLDRRTGKELNDSFNPPDRKHICIKNKCLQLWSC